MVDSEGEQFSLRWNNFHTNLTSGFHALLEGEDLVDVTLAAGGQFVQAHKLVLSVCSPYFKELFKVNPCKHPIVILKDVGHKELVAILSFMYQGEVNVRQDDLATFLKTAELLQIKGLTGDDSPAATNTPSPVPKTPERTPVSRQSAPLTSVLEPLVTTDERPVRSFKEESPVRPYKRMRAEPPVPTQQSSPVPVTPPVSMPPVQHSPSSSLNIPSPCTVNEDTSGIEVVELSRPKEEPIDYESDIEEVDSKISGQEDSLVQLLGGESSSQSHQDTSQGATPPIFASIPGLSQDSGGSQEGGQAIPKDHKRCRICGKILRRASLKRHIKDQHFPTEPMECDICDEGCRRNQRSKEVKPNSYRCDVCYKSFTRRDHLKTHEKNIHGEDAGPFMCIVCTQLYKNADSLRKHIAKFHSSLQKSEDKTAPIKSPGESNSTQSASYHEKYAHESHGNMTHRSIVKAKKNSPNESHTRPSMLLSKPYSPIFYANESVPFNPKSMNSNT